jgi:GDPmannose 4,6-dehydratase
MTRRALITGITGQDGSYLAEHLLAEGYEVWGLVRGQSNPRVRRVRELLGEVRLVRGDLLDQGSLIAAVERVQPDEVYNLAAISYVPMSWQQAELTGEVTGLGVLRVLEAIRVCSGISASRSPGSGQIRFYQASSSEIFGEPREVPQSEETPLAPVTPYGVAKAYAHFSARSYRHRYGLFACSGILYNHESPRRPLEFLPRKVAHGVAAISLGLQRELVLGDLDARRDWGYAGDYVDAMWRMLQQDEPDDYVVASGESHSVRELVDCAFAHVGLESEQYVRVDPALQRGAAELHRLVGDPSKARARLEWQPHVGFTQLVHLLVDEDLQRLRAGEPATSMERR